MHSRLKGSDKIYLSFDDGPYPDSTPSLLEWLDANGIQASFFCLGRQMFMHPKLGSKIRDKGHLLGHHGYHHYSGWNCRTKDYILNFQRSQQMVQSPYWRPPYGKINFRQYILLKKQCKIILWSHMPQDYESDRNTERMKSEARKQIPGGSIIVLHDRPDCRENTMVYLNALIEQPREFGRIDEEL